MLRRFLILMALLLPATAAAQTYPSKPIRLIVTFAPGGGADFVGRAIAQPLSEALGQTVVVDNRAGANGVVGADVAAKAAPDGYTVLLGAAGTLSVAPHLGEPLPFDPIKDFAPISQVFIAANVLVVPESVPAKTLPELIAFARAEPGKLTYAHAGAGTSQHLAAELLKSLTHIDIQPVAYRGTTALLPDLLAGRVTMSFANISNVAPLIREGKLRAFAVTSRKRSAVAPELPTMAELGYPDFEAVPWFGLMAPAGTSPAIIDKLYRETVKTLALPDVRSKLGELGLDLVANSPAEFSAVIAREIPQWAKVIKGAGIKME